MERTIVASFASTTMFEVNGRSVFGSSTGRRYRRASDGRVARRATTARRPPAAAVEVHLVAGRGVDRDVHVAPVRAPGGGPRDGALRHPPGDAADRAGLLGERQESVGRQAAGLGLAQWTGAFAPATRPSASVTFGGSSSPSSSRSIARRSSPSIQTANPSPPTRASPRPAAATLSRRTATARAEPLRCRRERGERTADAPCGRDAADRLDPQAARGERSSVARSAAYVANASSTSRAGQSSASGAGVEPLAARGAGSVLQRIARLAPSRAPWFSSAEEATVSPSSLATASRKPSSAARTPAPCSSVSAFCANSRSNTHAPLGLRGAPFRVERSEPVLTWRRRADPHAAGVVAAPEPRRVHDLHPADHPVADVTAEHDGARGASPRTRDGRRGKGRGRGDGGRPHRAPAGRPPGACRSDPDVRDARLEVVLRP